MIVYEEFHFGKEKHIAFYHPVDFSHFAHLHRSYELLYLKKGQLEVSVDGRSFCMEAGNLVLILPYEIHSYRDLGGSSCDVAVFSPDYIQEFYSQTEHRYLEQPVFEMETERLKRLQPILFEPCPSLFLTKAALYEMTACVLGQTTLAVQKGEDKDLLHEILLYIRRHYREELTLQELAEHLGYSRLYLSRYINQFLKQSFPDLIHEHRISQAIYLLENTKMPVSDVAFDCGYGSLRSFNRSFKRITDRTPREYREEMRKERKEPELFDDFSTKEEKTSGLTGNRKDKEI